MRLPGTQTRRKQELLFVEQDAHSLSKAGGEEGSGDSAPAGAPAATPMEPTPAMAGTSWTATTNARTTPGTAEQADFDLLRAQRATTPRSTGISAVVVRQPHRRVVPTLCLCLCLTR